MRGMRPRLRELVPVGAIALAISALGAYGNRNFYHDDAFIGLRYIRNLLAGNGLVWNPGERVQGYTNFLHLMAIAVCGALGLDLVVASRLVNACAFVLLIALLWRHCVSSRGSAVSSSAPGMISVLLVLCAYPLIVWTLGGLEGPLFTLCVTAGVLLFLQAVDSPHPERLLFGCGSAFALASLTRPDGLLFAGLTAVFILARGGGRRLQRGLHFAAPLVLLLGAYLVWQVSYYGDVVPNTFHVKAVGFSLQRAEGGLRYILVYLIAPPFALGLALAGMVYAALRRLACLPEVYLTTLIVGQLVYVVYIGGDHMPALRLLLPIIPCTAVLCGQLLSRLFRTGAKRWVAVGLYGLTLALLALQTTYTSINPMRRDKAAYVGTLVGRYIAEAWPANSLVALNTAGSTPYYAPRHRYIDMLGLNDRHIAHRHIDRLQLAWQRMPGHAKGDGAYVLTRSPDYVIAGPAEGVDIRRPWFLSDLEMSQDPRFAREYEMHQVRLDPQGREVDGPIGLLFTYYQKRK